MLVETWPGGGINFLVWATTQPATSRPLCRGDDSGRRWPVTLPREYPKTWAYITVGIKDPAGFLLCFPSQSRRQRNL